MTLIRGCGVCVVGAVGLLASTAGAQTWAEMGDAGTTLAAGNITTGSGALTQITGAIGAAGADVDIYRIRILNLATFRASTVGGASADTQVFLFDSTGRGVTMNDDAVGTAFSQSTITGQFVPVAGTYYLAVSQFDLDPVAGGNEIWADQPYIAERIPDGPGAAGTLSGWTGGATVAQGFAYTVTLAGAAFAVDPAGPGCPPNLAPAVRYGVGFDAQHVSTGDLNGDGKLDVVVSNGNAGNVSILLGNGDGTLQAAVAYTAGSVPRRTGVGDLNGDGRPDLAVGNSGGDNVSILLGNGDGTVQAAVNYGGLPSGARDVKLGDFNRDGRPDLAVAHFAGVVVMLGTGNANPAMFAAPVNYPIGTETIAVATGDMNGDGKPDLVVTNSDSDSVSVLLGNGNGTFQTPVSYAGGNGAQAVAVADFNADGRLDVAVTGLFEPSVVSVLLGNGNGTLQPRVAYSVPSFPRGLAAGDINGDGRPDLTLASSVGGNVSILLGNGDSTFQPAVSYESGSDERSVELGDFNRDGKPDLAVVNNGGADVSILLQRPGVPAPVITLQPISQSVPEGGLAFFTITATSPGGGLTYQWRRNGVNLIDEGSVAGANTPTLQISPLLAGYEAAYDCIVSNSCGSTQTAPAGLSVTGCGSADFNGDGDFGTDQDIEAFFRVLAGGGC